MHICHFSASMGGVGVASRPSGSRCCTLLSSFSTTFKAIVGTGILSLPSAIQAVGVLAGSVGLLFMVRRGLCCRRRRGVGRHHSQSLSHRGIRLLTLSLRFEACSLGNTLPLALQLSLPHSRQNSIPITDCRHPHYHWSLASVSGLGLWPRSRTVVTPAYALANL